MPGLLGCVQEPGASAAGVLDRPAPLRCLWRSHGAHHTRESATSGQHRWCVLEWFCPHRVHVLVRLQ
jgi:hypothetical protein